MRVIFVSIVIMFIAACSRSPSVIEADLVIQNVTTIDAQSAETAAQDIIIVKGKISQVVPHDPAATYIETTQLIEGDAHFAIPGLWDAHVHLAFDPQIDYRTFYPLSLAHGITALRDTGGHFDKLNGALNAQNDNSIAKPDLFISGPLIDGKIRVYDGEKPFFPDLSVGIAKPDSVAPYLDELQNNGASFIKIYELVSPQTYQALTQEARSRGLPIAAHVPLSMTAEDAARAGANDFQHLRNLEMSCSDNPLELLAARNEMLDQAGDQHGGALRSTIHNAQREASIARLDTDNCAKLINVLAQYKVIQTPTLTITRFTTHGLYGQSHYRKAFELMPQNVASGWAERSIKFANFDADEATLAFDAWVMGMIPRLKSSGVPIMAGTDAPIGFLVPGRSLHEELIMLVDAGLSPLEAIEAATLTPATFFNLQDERGLLIKGHKADIVLLRSNPLRDIRNTQSIDYVIQNGVIYDREALDDMLAAPSKL